MTSAQGHRGQGAHVGEAGEVRVAAVADIHLGRKPEEEATDAVIAWFGRVVERAAADGCEVLVFAGDLFDKRVKGEKRRARHARDGAVAMFRRSVAAGLPVVGVWGNHDVRSGLLGDLPPVDGVVFAPAGRPVVLEAPGVEVAFPAVSVEQDRDPRRLVPDFPRVDADRSALAVLHTGVQGEWTTNGCLPTTRGELLSTGYAGWVLGHVHQRLHLSEAPFIGFPGSPWYRRPDVPGGAEYTEIAVPLGGGGAAASARVVTV